MSHLELQMVKNHSRTNNILSTIILLSLISLLVITDTDMNSVLSFNLVNKRIELFSIVLSLYILIIIFFTKRIKVDSIFILLSLRIPFFLVQPLIYSEFNESFFANYLIVIIAPIVYQMVIMINTDSNILVKRIVKYSIIIIMIQLISVYIVNIGKSIPAYMFKSNLKIPLGGSNYIAAILLVLGIMSLKAFDKKSYALLSFVGIFLTLSNSGIITSILVLFIFLLKNSSKVRFISILKYVTGIVLVLGISLIIANELREYPYINSIFSRYSRLTNAVFNLGNNVNTSNIDISNGRLDIFSNILFMIKEKPILGWGLGIIENNSKVHNWLLQGLFNGGIIGLSIYIFPLLVAIKKLWRNRSLEYSYFCLLALFASLTQGLVEPNYFTPAIELIIWLFIGITLKDRRIKNKEERNTER